MARTSAFTLLEVMVVVAIIGLLAAIAVPNLTGFAHHHRATSASREVVSAFNAARALSYRRNEPVRVDIAEHELVLLLPNFTTPPVGFQVSITAWAKERRIALPLDVRLTDAGELTTGGSIVFCPSGEYRFLDGLGTFAPAGIGEPVCGLSNLASRSGRLVFTANNETFHIRIRAPIATFSLRLGAT